MARQKTQKSMKAAPVAVRRKLTLWLRRALFAALGLLALWIGAMSFLPVPTTPYMLAERARHNTLSYDWAAMDSIAPIMQRTAVAAEDANFCEHWGFDITALRSAIAGGAERGGSTISQQTVKNVFLWQGRSWPRKALEGLLTPVVELVWTKRRILEVYLNVAEFDTGVFGVSAAAQHYFGVSAADLSGVQAARLAAILPSPKKRSASKPGEFTRRRAASILDGAQTIRRDGRASCFQPK
ncbi:monofunctional biosynthetic peptidoglycan transglycosylase [Meridianimarinicoccus aquatilis]|uniref:Biosynthetic peptidoglycan transglycosylase n=1 Tax=Meridianimarinicoccus aquatilis TaxID=2552766 RepID=A0A4R6AYE2_9RHOB|nr:monofunctional biosynthetic peptidoglycan transglycosylase [Fluviibacterium aquatile]TDL89277.1 monofunctional biosynthetic peptidoglycan transglycosylase [Fluviibacterium aquatile]